MVLFGPDASRGLHNLTVQWLAAAVTLALEKVTPQG